jgi:N-hydroxyarylamine O-acetyltransferase
MDLDTYFARIGYDGSREPTLDVLRDLHLQHTTAIAFENLDPLMGRPVPLDIPSLEQKLVRSGRGGYCFEQNGLFLRVLQNMGFRVKGLSARVLRGRPLEESPRSHMLMKVDLDQGAYIADVGFGSLTLTAPLRLDDESPQETPHGVFRVVPVGDEIEEQALLDGEWQTQYSFTLQTYYPQDYESLNWYRSTHPDSPFVNILMAARPLADRRLGLRNGDYAIRYLDGRIEKKVLTDAKGIMRVLEDDFGITLPQELRDVERKLNRII